MLRGRLIHPQILEALGRAGHSSKILIADGNYPAPTKRPRGAVLVSVNLSSSGVDCAQVFAVLAYAIPIEAAAVMRPERSWPYAMVEEPEVWGEFRDKAASSDDVALVIATGELRLSANLLPTIGVVT